MAYFCYLRVLCLERLYIKEMTSFRLGYSDMEKLNCVWNAVCVPV